MRTLGLILFTTACAVQPVTDDVDDGLDAPVGKADAASTPKGAYTNPTPHYGELSTVSLGADHTFTRSSIVACAGGGTCPPLVEHGTFLLTHSSTKRYIHFYAADGSSLDKYQWKLSGKKLQLDYEGDDHWFTLGVGETCEAAGGTCTALVPDACEFGTVGDATQYSCGGGLGVECCLPAQADNQCAAASDCSGLLPNFCVKCSDGSTSCAHWSCVEGACQVASCGN